MKKFFKIAAGVYAYWLLDACCWSIVKKRGWKMTMIPGGEMFGRFVDWSVDVVDKRLDAWAELCNWEKTDTKEEDEFDPDDYDWEHIHVTVN